MLFSSLRALNLDTHDEGRLDYHGGWSIFQTGVLGVFLLSQAIHY